MRLLPRVSRAWFMNPIWGAPLLLVVASATVWAVDDTPVPAFNTIEGKLSLGAALLWALIGLWNRRGTKAVENKTDEQTGLLRDTLGAVNKMATGMVDLHTKVDNLRQVQEQNDELTTEELAQHADALQALRAGQDNLQAGQEQQSIIVAEHGHRISVLADGLARVQTIVAQRKTDTALAEGLVAALTPTPPPPPPSPPKE